MKNLSSGLMKLDGKEDQRLHTAFNNITSAIQLLEKIDVPDDDSPAADLLDLTQASDNLKTQLTLLQNTSHIRKPLPTPPQRGNQIHKPPAVSPQNGPENGAQLRYLIELDLQALLKQVKVLIDTRLETTVATTQISWGMTLDIPLADQIADCEKQLQDIKVLRNTLEKKISAITLPSLAGSASLDKEKRNNLQHLDKVEQALAVLLESLKGYQQPDSVKNVCNVKTLELTAARQAITSINKKIDPANQKLNQNLLDFIDCRLDHIASISCNPQGHDGPSLLGQPKVPEPPASRPRPFDAARQKNALDKQVKQLVTQINKASNKSDLTAVAAALQTKDFNERMVLMSLLRYVKGIDDPTEAFGRALDLTLRQQDWTTVQSKLVVPIGDKADGKFTIIETELNPEGMVMTDAEKIKILSKKSPLKPDNFEDLKNPLVDSHGNPKKPSTGGVRSRSTTETKHPTMAAHTSCRIGDTPVFGATRTGVNDPYGLNKNNLKKKSHPEVAALTRNLIGSQKWSPTQVSLGDSKASLDNQIDQEKRLENERFDQSVDAIADYLLNTSDGKKIFNEPSKIFSEASQAAKRGQAISIAKEVLLEQDAKSDAILGRIAIDCKPLQLIMRRQGALNRARVTFLLEIQRDPAFAQCIKDGKPIMFTSVSLLSPDSLRQNIFDKLGIDGFNEQEMMDLHVQSWRDLQAEIDRGGLYVNNQPVKANILSLNFGVNANAFNKGASAPVIGEAISGFQYANVKANHDSLKKLVGIDKSGGEEPSMLDVFVKEQHKLLDEPSADEDKETIRNKISIVTKLGQQIADIYIGDKYKTAGNDPYKIASRVAVLSFMIGGGTAFNCKSGKDRTGQLDIEAKCLAVQIATTGQVPDPETEKSDLEKNQLLALSLLDLSSAAMQKYSTGYAGFKLGGVDALFNNLVNSGSSATDAIKRAFKGLSTYTGSM